MLLEDGEQAMRVIRSHAEPWGLDPKGVGAMGFSAGGHFVSTLITRCTSDATRPDFAVLVYPVISMHESAAHTRENLLGAQSDCPRARKRHSTCEHVREGMPEVFIVLCDDDKMVDPGHSILFYTALRRHGVGAELHIYPDGGHGFWMRDRYRYEPETCQALMRWIKQR